MAYYSILAVTPKGDDWIPAYLPAAQLPSADPDLLVHSDIVRQVPLLVESEAVVHCSFWNVTMLNRLNSSGNKESKGI